MNNQWMQQIDTPALVIDVPQMKRNIAEYHEAVERAGSHVRAHTKTHKMPRIAKLQLEMGARGIAVAKLSEAEIMADAGLDDILIAYPVIGQLKLERLARLNRRLDRLIISVESMEGGRQLSDMGVKAGKPFKVIVDVDTGGMKRTGFPHEEAYDAAIALSKLPGIEVIGIYAYAYMTYQGRQLTSPQEAGHLEGQAVVALAERLRQAGVPIEITAGGSTPTARYTAEVPGISEVHPGEYPFRDVKVRHFGYRLEDCAAKLLFTVVSSSPERIVVDGGCKTMSTDVALHTPPADLDGYGVVVGYEDELVIDKLSEEHGVIHSKTGKPLDIPIGTKLLVIPNHICPTLTLHNFAYFVDGETVEKVRIEGRGALE